MSEPKPFASLSSGLLARKGAAKPAMRPQVFGQVSHIEDLGWNDMGHVPGVAPNGNGMPIIEEHDHVPSSIEALTPAPKSPDKHDELAVIEQQRAIAASFPVEQESFPAEQEAIEAYANAPASVVALPRKPRQAPGLKDKAAFTLRLDTQRHLKLRLACALMHRSAQQIVTEALDSLLTSIPDVDNLAQQISDKPEKSQRKAER
jgi:hypothetical protein